MVADTRSWTRIHEKYNSVSVLGHGTYGVVYKAERLALDENDPNTASKGDYVALKRQSLESGINQGVPDTALREIAILKDFKHENVVSVLEFSCNLSRLYIVLELMERDLKQHVKDVFKSTSEYIPTEDVKKVVYKTLKGVNYMHVNRVIHRDLKPHNILVSKSLDEVKLADFGLARAKHAPGKTLTHEVVTLWYRAPEILLGHCNYTEAIDIWAIGCILAELLIGTPLFSGENELDTLLKAFNMLGTPEHEHWPERAMQLRTNFPQFAAPEPGHFAKMNKGRIDESAANLLDAMLRIPSSQRCTAAEALSHPWFDSVRDPEPIQQPSQPRLLKMLSDHFEANDTNAEGREESILQMAMSRESTTETSETECYEDFSYLPQPQETCPIGSSRDISSSASFLAGVGRKFARDLEALRKGLYRFMQVLQSDVSTPVGRISRKRE